MTTKQILTRRIQKLRDKLEELVASFDPNDEASRIMLDSILAQSHRQIDAAILRILASDPTEPSAATESSPACSPETTQPVQ